MSNDVIADRQAAVPDRERGATLAPERRREPTSADRALQRNEIQRAERAGPRRFDDLF
jgi:hypothetical protein